MDNYLLSQIIGLVAILFSSVVAYVYDSRKFILVCKIFSSFLWVAHFYFLGFYVACINYLIIIGITIVCYFRRRLPCSDSNAYPVAFLLINTALSLRNFTSFADIFSFCGSSLSVIGRWQIKTRNVRMLALIATFFWIPHNLITGSIVGMCASALGVITVSIAIWRFDIPERKRVVVRK